MMLGRAKLRIGIDIGTNSIKLVAYHSKKKSELSRLAMIDFVKEEIVKHPDDIVESHIINGMNDLLKELPYKKASIRICISTSLNNLFVVHIPPVGEQELKEALFWELGSFLPEPVKNYEYDYQILHRNNRKKQMTILVGVVHKSQLERILRIFRELGTTVDILETDTLSALHVFLTRIGDVKESVGFLQLGASHCNYTILTPESDPKFLYLPFGGNLLNDVIGRNQGMSFTAAENLRREIKEGNNLKKKEDSLIDMNHHIWDVIKHFASVINRFNIHHQHKTGRILSKIVVTGGLLNDQLITKALEQSPNFFQVNCEFWDPIETYFSRDLVEPNYRYHFAPALGLALR